MSLLGHDAMGSPEGNDGRRRDMWVATGNDRRVTLFRPGKLYCPNGHHVAEHAKMFEGSGARLCDKKSPSAGGRGERSHEGRCDTWLYVLAGLRAFDGADPTSLQLAIEVTPVEMREISSRNLGTVEAAEFLGLLAWTRR